MQNSQVVLCSLDHYPPWATFRPPYPLTICYGFKFSGYCFSAIGNMLDDLAPDFDKKEKQKLDIVKGQKIE
jgi:hypothetical protein